MKRMPRTTRVIIPFALSFLFFGNAFPQIEGGSTLILDGSLDYVEIPDSPELTPPTSSITAEAWVRTDSTLLTSNQTVVCKYNSTGGASQLSWALSVRPGPFVRLGVYESFTTGRTFDSETLPISPGVWAHIAASFDIATQEGRVFVNGTEYTFSLVSGSADSIRFIADTDTPVRIGTIVTYWGDFTQFWSGNIDEVRIWNFARTGEQIQSTMNVILPAEYYSSADSGLVGYWRCEQLEDLGVNSDGPDDIGDLSVFANHGDCVGDAGLELVTSVSGRGSELPADFALRQNYPNPFNPSTTIKYEFPKASHVTLAVYDLLGREVVILVNAVEEPGYKSVEWDATGLTSGVYFYRLTAGDFTQTKKLLLLR